MRASLSEMLKPLNLRSSSGVLTNSGDESLDSDELLKDGEREVGFLFRVLVNVVDEEEEEEEEEEAWCCCGCLK